MPYATNDDVRIHYDVEGAGPALLIHTGFVSWARDWYTLGYVEALQSDYRLILLDPRGQGESDKPHIPEAYGVDHRVEDVVAVLDAAEVDRVRYWGYSMGGRVGFDLALRHPQRVSALLLGGTHPAGAPADPALAALLRSGIDAFLAADTMQQFPAEIRQRWTKSDVEALASALVGEPSLAEQLPTIDIPTLLYCGMRADEFERAVRAASALPNATFVALPGLDHVGGVVHAEMALPYVRAFLAGLTPEA